MAAESRATVGIIGGSSFSDGWLEKASSEAFFGVTPYGLPSSPVREAEISGRRVLLLLRHGLGHRFPPHAVPYAANLWALKKAGAEAVIGLATVGGINEALPPGALCVPDDLVDRTWGRESTIYSSAKTGVRHVDFTRPFDEELRRRLILACRRARVSRLLEGGVYWCSQGPRLETAAEIRVIRALGGAMVGMTAATEAAVARELDVPYALLALCVNWAAGLHSSSDKVSLEVCGGENGCSSEDIRCVLEQFLAL